MKHAVFTRVALTASAVLAASIAVNVARANADAAAAPGRFVPDQVRIFDTRSGLGGFTTPMPADAARSLTVAGTNGVPASGVSAIAITVTVVGATSLGNLAVAPGDATTFTSGTALTYNVGDTDSNTALVALDDTGRIKLFSDHSVDLVVDLQGYYVATAGTGGGFVPVSTTRVVDTRTGIGVPAGKIPNGGIVTVTPGSRISLPTTAIAVYASITVVNQTASGFVTAYPTGSAVPAPYSLNFDNPGPQALGTTIPLNSDGQFDVRVAGGPLDIIVDIEGYYDSDAAAASLTPAQSRRYDSRISPNTALAANETRTVTIGGMGNIPAQTGAVAINVITVDTSGTTGGFLTAWTAGQPEPAVSSINFATANTLRSSLVLVKPDISGHITIHNHSTGTVHVVLDAEGWFPAVP